MSSKKESSMGITQAHDALPNEESLGELEPVFHFNDAMPTGVTVSHSGRIFVNFPKWGDNVSFTVSEIRDNKAVAYPDEVMNQTNPNDLADGICICSIRRS